MSPAADRPELRRIARQIRTAISRRDEMIVDAFCDGVSLREIAAAVGISHVTVRNIIIRHAKAKPVS